MKKKVEFEAHKIVNKPAEVEFRTTAGKRVDFIATKKNESSCAREIQSEC